MKDDKKKCLIVNADDFGLNSSVNQAVLNGYLKGCLTSASLFAVAPECSFKEAVEILRSNKGLDFGLQIVLTSDVISMFKPLSRGISITRNGFFYKNPLRWAWTLSQKKFRPQIKREIRKQIEKVLKIGLKPSHLNSHYYVTELPGLTEILIELAQEHKIKAIRNPYERKSFVEIESFKPTRYTISQIVKVLSWWNRKKIINSGLTTNDHYYGVYCAGRMNVERILQALAHLKSGVTELLVHPALENSPYFHERDEYRAIISSQVKEYIKNNGISLTCFRDLSQ